MGEMHHHGQWVFGMTVIPQPACPQLGLGEALQAGHEPGFAHAWLP